MREKKMEKEERVREVKRERERGGICVWRLAAHFSWKRALIAISSNAHHGKDEVISPAPSPSLAIPLPPRIRKAFNVVGLGWGWG